MEMDKKKKERESVNKTIKKKHITNIQNMENKHGYLQRCFI